MVALYSTWAAGKKGYIRNFQLLPFWVPIAPTVLRVGGPTYTKFGMVIDLSSVLDKFVLDFR